MSLVWPNRWVREGRGLTPNVQAIVGEFLPVLRAFLRQTGVFAAATQTHLGQNCRRVNVALMRKVVTHKNDHLGMTYAFGL